MKCISLCKNKLCNKTIPNNKIYCKIIVNLKEIIYYQIKIKCKI